MIKTHNFYAPTFVVCPLVRLSKRLSNTRLLRHWFVDELGVGYKIVDKDGELVEIRPGFYLGLFQAGANDAELLDMVHARVAFEQDRFVQLPFLHAVVGG